VKLIKGPEAKRAKNPDQIRPFNVDAAAGIERRQESVHFLQVVPRHTREQVVFDVIIEVAHHK